MSKDIKLNKTLLDELFRLTVCNTDYSSLLEHVPKRNPVSGLFLKDCKLSIYKVYNYLTYNGIYSIVYVNINTKNHIFKIVTLNDIKEYAIDKTIGFKEAFKIALESYIKDRT